jgi:hypothetical protein
LLREARDAYAGPFELGLRMEPLATVPAGSPSAFWSEPPSGYESSTLLSGEVVLGESRFFEGRARSSDRTVFCPDWFEVSATVPLATADGAFDVIAEGQFVLGGAGFAQNLSATADLAGATGTLDLHLDPSFEYNVELLLDLETHPAGKRGSLWLTVRRLSGPSRLDSSYSALGGDFPDDGCGVGFPASPDAPLAAFDGQSAAQVLTAWSERLAAAQPIPGVRYDCVFDGDGPLTPIAVPVEMRFELGAAETVCQSSPSAVRGSPGGFGFAAPIRVKTSDGLIDAAFAGGSASAGDLALVSDPGEEIPAGEFASRTGIGGVNPGDSPWLSAIGQASFQQMGDALASGGSLVVRGVDCESPLGCVGTIHANLVWGADAATSVPLCN